MKAVKPDASIPTDIFRILKSVCRRIIENTAEQRMRVVYHCIYILMLRAKFFDGDAQPGVPFSDQRFILFPT
jgi:hypothetical protein